MSGSPSTEPSDFSSGGTWSPNQTSIIFPQEVDSFASPRLGFAASHSTTTWSMVKARSKEDNDRASLMLELEEMLADLKAPKPAASINRTPSQFQTSVLPPPRKSVAPRQHSLSHEFNSHSRKDPLSPYSKNSLDVNVLDGIEGALMGIDDTTSKFPPPSMIPRSTTAVPSFSRPALRHGQVMPASVLSSPSNALDQRALDQQPIPILTGVVAPFHVAKVKVLFWDKLPRNSKSRPCVWHFEPAYNDQGAYIVPSSNENFLDVLKTPGSRNKQSIAWLDDRTNAWNCQDVDEPIYIEDGRPVLLCNYRIADTLSINWVTVRELTGYKHKSFEPTHPYRSRGLVSPSKRGEHSMRDKPAGQVLQTLEEFELDLATNKRGEPVINRFRSRFRDFKGSISAMNRIRRAARALSEEERKVYTSPNAGRMFGEIIDNHKGGH
ncbi:hypothetical protein PIIN_09776 [Serendipita indica DSM 11827]|uniref:Uncharacterized protein n=1 Tax=Serendipita indica (strain DSM 11827) TaxID=1109443 RepID=G4TWU5_SERID|nr:hypothetical protein PIIN_09776 [Serendipita indica DSM 11827]